MNQLEVLKDETPTLEALLRLNNSPETDVKTMVLQELEYLNQIAMGKPELKDCLPQTIVASVRSALKQNLSLDPNAGLVYVTTRSIEVVKGQWKKIMEVSPSANGLISINRQCGTILDIKNPVVEKDSNGKVIGVSVEILLPSYGQPRWEKRSFDESDFMRWRIASHKQNGRSKQDASLEKLNYANSHYTSWKGGIDPEFARAKAIRHGLKKLGTNPNEKRAIKIFTPSNKEIIIDPEMDRESYNDEVEEVTFTDATVITNESNTNENSLPDANAM